MTRRWPDEEPSEPRKDRALCPVPLVDLMTSPTPAPPFVVAGLIPRRDVTLLGGHGGAGKSILGLTLTAHVAGGAITWAGFTVEDGRAMFVSLEDPGDVVRFRLKRIVEAYALDAAKVERRLTVLDGTGGDSALVGEVNIDGVRRLGVTPALGELAEAAQGHRLIVVDGASDAFDGNENERRQVRSFIRELARIARDNDAGMILLAHVDKHAARNGAQGNTYSGSTAWHNSVRARLALVATEGTVELIPEKLQHGKLADPIPLAWTDAGVLVPTTRSIEVHSPITDAEDQAVLTAMLAAAEADTIVPAAASGPLTAWSVLRTMPECAVFDNRDGKRRFQRALTRLQRGSSIVVNEYRDQHRHPKKQLVLRECASAQVPPHPLITAARFQSSATVCASSGTAAQLPQTAAEEYRRGEDGE